MGRDVNELRLALLRATNLHFEEIVLEMLKQVECLLCMGMGRGAFGMRVGRGAFGMRRGAWGMTRM